LYEDAEDIVLENPPEAHSLLLSAAETLRHVIASGYNDIAFHLTLAKVLSFPFQRSRPMATRLTSRILCIPPPADLPSPGPADP
jgi:hypothetical protein